MTSCDKFVPLFTEYLDGNLSGQSKSEFEEHIQSCSDCAQTVQHLKTLQVQLKQLTPVKTSDAFNVILRSRIRYELEKPSLWDQVVTYFLVNRVPAFATGFAMLLLVSFFSYSLFFRSNDRSDVFVPVEVANEQPIAQTFYPSSKKSNQPAKQDVYYVIDQFRIEEVLADRQKGDNHLPALSAQAIHFDTLHTIQPAPIKIIRAAHPTSVCF